MSKIQFLLTPHGIQILPLVERYILMRDARSHRGRWTRDAQAFVAGKGNSPFHSMAILKVSPMNVPFRIGWRDANNSHASAEFYSEVAQTDSKGQLAMTVGSGGVVFVARPVDATTALTIELVELIDQDDAKYKDTPYY